MPASGSRIQKRSRNSAQQRVGIGADRIEGDIAEVEQAGETDDDVQAPAEHDVDEDLDAEIVDPLQRALHAEEHDHERRIEEQRKAISDLAEVALRRSSSSPSAAAFAGKRPPCRAAAQGRR
jgi:hypothetical protein